VWFWNGKAFESLIPDKTKISGTADAFGPELGFAAGLVAARPETPIYLIKFYRSGQPLHYGWKASGEWMGAPPAPKRATFYPGRSSDDPNVGLHY
jgi:hypothetical protein